MRNSLRKLDAAQARPRCVFAAGMAYDVTFPHLQTGLRVVKLWRSGRPCMTEAMSKGLSVMSGGSSALARTSGHEGPRSPSWSAGLR